MKVVRPNWVLQSRVRSERSVIEANSLLYGRFLARRNREAGGLVVEKENVLVGVSRCFCRRRRGLVGCRACCGRCENVRSIRRLRARFEVLKQGVEIDNTGACGTTEESSRAAFGKLATSALSVRTQRSVHIEIYTELVVTFRLYEIRAYPAS